MCPNVLGMQCLAFRSNLMSPVAKSEMRATNERKPLNAKCCIPDVTVRVFQSSFEKEIVISPQNRLSLFLFNVFISFSMFISNFSQNSISYSYSFNFQSKTPKPRFPNQLKKMLFWLVQICIPNREKLLACKLKLFRFPTCPTC